FAARIGVPLETVRNWEQGKRSPRGPARALLKVIEKAPDVAFAILGGGGGQWARGRGACAGCALYEPRGRRPSGRRQPCARCPRRPRREVGRGLRLGRRRGVGGE